MTTIESPTAARTVPALLRAQADAFGARPLLTIAGAQWSHRDAAEVAACRAAALRAAGVARGDRVALMCGNRAEFIETFLGCAWLGAAAVPINTASMGPQIEYLLADSGARLLVIEDAYVARLAGVERSRTALQAVWVVGESTRVDGVRCARWPVAGAAIAPEPAQPGDTLAILYTSGTTGPAKGVMCPQAQLGWWGMHSARILGLTASDVLCTTLPLFHINALNTLAQAAVSGAQVVYETRFSASGFWSTMARREATVGYLLGAMVPILLAQPAGAAERQHRMRIALAPGVPAAAGAAFHARTGVALVEGYGSTETNFVIATTPDSARRGVMGWVRPGFAAKVAEDGELLLRSDDPLRFSLGYHGMPEKTREAFRDGWFHTGDRVALEPDGAFRFVDRLKDSIRRRGENVSSYEVEQVLLGHPEIAAAAVYPVRSDLAEDEVMAAIVMKPGSAIDAQALAAFCAERLPYFAVPGFVEVLDDLPRTENGKVQKFRLRERGVSASAIRLPRARRV
jgi:carnitine-CoA ligase